MDERNSSNRIGKTPWSRQEIKNSVDDFYRIYCNHPDRKNYGGMGPTHQFLLWFIISEIKPNFVVESGVWRGYGSWVIEKACPNAQIHCIEPNLPRVEYHPENATYYSSDFSEIDWGNLPSNETVLFFDDHQNASARLQQARKWGFRHLIFDDNYPPDQGDCYSLKQILEDGAPRVQNWRSMAGHLLMAKSLQEFGQKLEKLLSIRIKKFDADSIRSELATYQELPPVIAPKSRWGVPWEHYNTPKPLLEAPREESHLPFDKAKKRYNWMCYAEIDYSN